MWMSTEDLVVLGLSLLWLTLLLKIHSWSYHYRAHLSRS